MQPKNALFSNKPDIAVIKNMLDEALREDFGIRGDITSSSIISDDTTTNFKISARDEIILSGTYIAEYYFKNYSAIEHTKINEDSGKLYPGDGIFVGTGPAREVLMLERVILNFLQHLSGIATLTNNYVNLIAGTRARICDTRKTTPNLRMLQKYAVRCGGGYNHRLAMDSAIMIKDNHIAICGSIASAMELAKQANPHYAAIEVECDTLKQVDEALASGADIIMLDNMNVDQIQKAVEIIKDKAIIEASGGVNLDNVAAIAKTGVDFISVGRLTNSAPAVDIGLDIIVD